MLTKSGFFLFLDSPGSKQCSLSSSNTREFAPSQTVRQLINFQKAIDEATAKEEKKFLV